jgi:hypothetical protein
MLLSKVIALHCMRFSWACLPICQYCTVKTIKNIVENWLPNLLKNIFLSTVHVKYMIEHKRNILRFCVFNHQLSIFIDSVKACGVIICLSWIERSKSAEYFDVSFSFHKIISAWFHLNRVSDCAKLGKIICGL